MRATSQSETTMVRNPFQQERMNRSPEAHPCFRGFRGGMVLEVRCQRQDESARDRKAVPRSMRQCGTAHLLAVSAPDTANK